MRPTHRSIGTGLQRASPASSQPLPPTLEVCCDRHNCYRNHDCCLCDTVLPISYGLAALCSADTWFQCATVGICAWSNRIRVRSLPFRGSTPSPQAFHSLCLCFSFCCGVACFARHCFRGPCVAPLTFQSTGPSKAALLPSGDLQR